MTEFGAVGAELEGFLGSSSLKIPSLGPAKIQKLKENIYGHHRSPQVATGHQYGRHISPQGIKTHTKHVSDPPRV